MSPPHGSCTGAPLRDAEPCISSRSLCFYLALVAVVHLSFASLYLPFDASILASPIYNDDYSFHYWAGQVASRLKAETGVRYGWDPHFMAGYPFSWILDTSGLLYERLFTWCSRLPSVPVFNFYVLFACLVVPLVAFFAALAFGSSRSNAVLYAFLSVLSTWLSHNAMYVKDGMVSWLLASHLWVLATGVVWRFLILGNVFSLVLLALLMIALPYIHQIALPLLALSFCLVPLFAMGHLTGTRILGLVLILGAGCILHCEWLQELWMFLPAFDLAYVYDDYKEFILNPWFSLLDLLDPFKLVLFGLFGMLIWKRRVAKGTEDVRSGLPAERSDVVRRHVCPVPPLPRYLLMVLCGGFFLLTYVSPFVVDMSKANNLRFSVLFLNLLLMLFTEDLARMLPLHRLGSRRLRPLLIGVAAACLLGGILYKPKILKTTYPEEFEELVRVIASSTGPSARILLEDGAHSFSHSHYEGGHPLFGGHLFARLPLMVEREFIGGPHSIASLREHYVAFQNSRLLGKPLTQWTSREFLETARLYNIGWIVCWHEDSKEFFSKELEGSVERMAAIGRFEVYRLLRDHSFMIGGKGEIRADYNTISVKHLRLDQGSESVKLLYHYNEYMVSSPSVVVQRAVLNDDPIGFIEVLNPPSSFELRFTRELPWKCPTALLHF